MKIIACDFDGTLCVNNYPNIGEPKTEIINALIEEKNKGTKIILWTCRTEAQIKEAVEWCAQQGLTFDAVNDNVPEMQRYFGCNPRKVFANEYWDDRAKKV